MSRVAYVNGSYVPHASAAVHIEDRGYQFGDGVYEVVHVDRGRLIDEDLHMARLDRSLRELRLKPLLGRAALHHVLVEMTRRNRIANGLLYIQVTRGVARRDHVFPGPGVAAALVVTMRRLKPYPASIEEWTGTAITLPDQRWARCDIKSINLLPNILARQAAREQGATEALLIGAGDILTEGAATSVWVVDQAGRLRLRPLDQQILPGCTRAALLDLLQAEHIEVLEGPCTLDELRRAREIFLTSATSFVKPMLRLDGAPVGDGSIGPVARRLFGLFARHVQGPAHNAPGHNQPRHHQPEAARAAAA
jgi:D-alanine transaminase